MRRPLASLNADYPTYQRHGGWQFGYFTAINSRRLEQLVWRKEEGKWGCPDPAQEFPSARPGALLMGSSQPQSRGIACRHGKDLPNMLQTYSPLSLYRPFSDVVDCAHMLLLSSVATNAELVEHNSIEAVWDLLWGQVACIRAHRRAAAAA
jgi:hypothetical protein